jgi:hypothetical protein
MIQLPELSEFGIQNALEPPAPSVSFNIESNTLFDNAGLDMLQNALDGEFVFPSPPREDFNFRYFSLSLCHTNFKWLVRGIHRELN